MSRLQKIDITDFTGGLNLREGQLQLADSESPSMQNMDVDPRSGFFTRPGWARWTADDIVTGTWDPRHAASHQLSTGAHQTYITNEADIYAATDDGDFGVDTPLGVPCNAAPHLADFGSWGDTLYIATGRNAAAITGAPTKRVGAAAPVALADASVNFNDDYTNPTAESPAMPFADYVEPHAGYLFVASTKESTDGEKVNRIRWSHPDAPEAWATDDFLDIEVGGGYITGLRSFRDHLVIFKSDSIWALYGYDLESWQLIQISRAIGAPTTTAIARSENTLYFLTPSGRNGIYSYDGASLLDIGLPLEAALEEMTQFDDLWLGWVGRRLWCSVPWDFDDGPAGTGVFVYDPDVGRGSWTFHKPAAGELRSPIEDSDVGNNFPLAVLGGSVASTVMQLDFDPNTARDDILPEVTSSLLLETGDALLLESGDALLLEEVIAPIPFRTWYRTAWQHAGWPELRKSWLRSKWIARRSAQAVELRLDVFKDYEESNPSRTLTGGIGTDGSVFWRELGFDDPAGSGFDFKALGADDPSGRGADFSAGAAGSRIGRTTSGFGPAAAIQILVSGADSTLGLPWAIDAIFIKLVFRRFTT